MARLAQAGLTALAALALAAPASAAPRLFPSDAGSTVRDTQQQTGRRIALRLPSCALRPAECNDIGLLNRLDGFDLEPRIEVRFERAIDARRITRDTLHLEPVDRGPRIGVNRVVYDSRARVLSARPAEILRGGVRYRLVVALPGQRASTTFTTMTATLQTRAMRTLAARRPHRLQVTHRFAAADVRALRARTDTGAGGLVEAPVPDLARAQGGIYAFGTLRARQWLRADRTIRQVASRRTPAVEGTETLGVSLVVPAGSKPRDGWPVAIFGHGFTRSRLDLYLAAEDNARRGIATLALTIPGHGGGPAGRLLVDLADGRTVDLPLLGRAVDLDRNGRIDASEGSLTALPPSPVATVTTRDVLRQAALDVSALASALRRGVDVDGDGEPDLRRDRVGYYGQSFGGIYGPIAAAVNPRLRPAVFNVPGGSVVDISLLSESFRPLAAALLGRRTPSLLNGGRAGFTHAEPLYGAGSVIDPPAGAMAIDEVLAVARWINRSGSPDAYADAGLVGDDEVLFQVAFGDRTVPNPTSAALIRAADARERTVVFRNDRTTTAGRNPHGFLLDPSFGRPRQVAQAQIVAFLRRPVVRDPDGRGRAWERGPALSLLDRLNFPPSG